MRIENKKSEMERALGYVEQELGRLKLSRRDVVSAMLTAEESILALMEHAPEDAEIEITLKKRFGSASLTVSAPGEAFDIAESGTALAGLESREIDRDMESAIRALVLRARADTFRYKNRAHRSTIQILVKRSERTQLYLTLAALVLSVVLGTAFRVLLPPDVQTGLDQYLLTPVKTMFLNALKTVIGPVVFFSIVSCLSQFDSLRDLGKIGAKVMGMYLFTTLISTLVGVGVFLALKPGSASISSLAAGTAGTAAGTAEISILDTVVGIVPSNFVKPFLETDMLQIIFLALLCGAAAGMIGDYSKPLREFFEACNLLFLKITSLIVKVIPLAVLCSMTSLMMLTGTETLSAIMSFLGTYLLGLAAMIFVYCLLVLVIGRLNPLTFLKKHAPAMVTSLSLASSSASIPFNVQSCRNLGVSQKVCAFSIPLGATVNMDGSCIYFSVAGLFLARVFGVELDGAAMVSMIFSMIVLSIGAPGIPGSALVCMSVLLIQIGVPVEGLSLLMGIDPILGMLRTAVNSTGDVAVSLIVAKTEGLVDIEQFEKLEG